MATIYRIAGIEMIIPVLTGEIIMIVSKATITIITETLNVEMFLTGQMISRAIITGMVILKDAEIFSTGIIIITQMIGRSIMTEEKGDLLTGLINSLRPIRLNRIPGMNKDEMSLTGTGIIIPLRSQRDGR
jgi:hypothetical protein